MNHRIAFPRTARLAGAALALAAAFGLAACGSDDNGGGGGSAAQISGNTVLPSAGASSDSFIATVRQVVARGMDETSEPLAVQGVAQPPEDTAEPVSVL